MDAEEREATLRDTATSHLGGLELWPQIEKPGLEAGVTNLLDLLQHAKESIEASGIDGPRIGLRPQLDAGPIREGTT